MTTTNISGFSSSGAFNRQKYDRCAYQKDLYESVSPLSWMMYPGKFENCSKCTVNEKNFWRPFDGDIVDRESDLKNITRRSSRCPQKYLPNCKKSATCTNTFDPSNPIVLAQEVCPIVFNNIPKMYGPGYELKTEPFCQKRIPRNPNY
jgi:hypothetical protein